MKSHSYIPLSVLEGSHSSAKRAHMHQSGIVSSCYDRLLLVGYAPRRDDLSLTLLRDMDIQASLSFLDSGEEEMVENAVILERADNPESGGMGHFAPVIWDMGAWRRVADEGHSGIHSGNFLNADDARADFREFLRLARPEMGAHPDMRPIPVHDITRPEMVPSPARVLSAALRSR